MKYNTIIFVPHAKAKFRKLTVSSRLLAAVAAGSAVVLLAALAFGWAFFFTSHRDRQYLQVVADNARLKSSSTALQARLEGLSRQLTAFETRTRRLAIVAGLAESGRTGAGGPLLSDLPWSSLDERSATVGSRLSALEGQFARRETLVSSTPTVAPVRGLLNSGFGVRRDPFTGEGAFHAGLDISTLRNEPVLATASGIVVKSGWRGDYGKAVEIDHGTGYRTVYGHLATILVRDGQKVQRGERVGLVGSTGRSTGPHLHYEVRQGDRILNPLEYILDAK
ncbi:MAG TPA: M23 family metallopeptidase [Thermoanaerobaculia bacterium]|nr:M23 family metallopeptidase [Thermoanaerobaculia bacterium]